MNEEILTMIGSILLLAVGVAAIIYVLMRKSPVKATEEIVDADDATQDSDATNENADL
jgi:hypothetical protein